MPRTLFVVATPIGNLEDITARALRVLRDATVIAAEDTRRTAHLLARYAITTPTTSLHEHNEVQKSAALIRRLEQGDDVALVSDAGTPTVSDPGQRLIRMALDAGIRVEPVPGPNAAVALLSASGLPAETYTFLGFPPTRSKDLSCWLETLKTTGRTVVFFEAPHRVVGTLQHIQSVIGDVQVAIGRELTKAHEELVVGPISTAIERVGVPKGEFTVAVDCGHIPEKPAVVPAGDDTILSEFTRMTEDGRMSRRKAIAAIAKKHRRSTNEVYRTVERAKNSGK